MNIYLSHPLHIFQIYGTNGVGKYFRKMGIHEILGIGNRHTHTHLKPFNTIQKIPFMISSLQNTSVDWGYTVEKSKKSGQYLAHNITWPSGKLLGGSSAMNSMFYLRGNQRDFDEWELLGNPTWSWQHVIEHFKKAENYQQNSVVDATDIQNAATEHGTSGPLPINSFKSNEPFKQTLFDAAAELGYKQLEDLNGNEFMGIGSVPGIVDNGKSSNSAKAYLSLAKDRPNLHVIKYAHVNSVTVDNTTGQVTGVQFQVNQTHDLTATATKETILSAGAIGTPKILQLSGIGPEKQLRRLNIPTVRNLQTGFNLQTHFTVPIFMQFNPNTLPTDEAQANATDATSIDSLYEYIKQRDVLSLSNVFDVLGFFNAVNVTDAYPNIGTHYAIFKRDDQLSIGEYLNRYGLNETVAQPIIDANKLADIAVIFVTLLNPLALGKVRVRSADPYELPAININLDRREDIASLVQGIQLARTFLNTTAYQTIGAEEIPLIMPECEVAPVKKVKTKQQTTKPPKNKGNKHEKNKKGKGATTTTTTEEPLPVVEPQPEVVPYGSDQYFECYVKQIASIPYGPVGSSKMGPNTDRFAVVDSRLKVHGLTGLRVIDASVMPRIVSAPTGAATIMIAEKGSDFIKEDWPLVTDPTTTADDTPQVAEGEADATPQHTEL